LLKTGEGGGNPNPGSTAADSDCIHLPDHTYSKSHSQAAGRWLAYSALQLTHTLHNVMYCMMSHPAYVSDSWSSNGIKR